MPLSIAKLHDLLTSKGFVPTKHFVMDGLCFYIELFSIKTAEIFLMYIPSKYEFEMSEGDDVFKIKYIDMENVDNLTDEYAGKATDDDAEKAYGDMKVHLSPDQNVEEHLEGGYKHQISLDDISKEDSMDIRAIFRQVRRLKNCVQNIKYKLAVIYKNYMCSIRRDDTISCFSIKHHPRTDKKKLFVITDLETFYEKNEKLIEDVKTVRETIYRVLERNQGMHSSMINRILLNKKEIVSIPQQANLKKTEYDSLYAELENMLKTMTESERRVVDEMYKLDKQENTGLQSDISKAHNKSRLEKELDKINSVKGEITRGMISIREKRENSILGLDKIMFDNTVMVDAIIKNFAKLKEFC